MPKSEILNRGYNKMNTFPTLTNDKETFEFIKNHLITQNCRSSDYFETCLYRGHTQEILDKAIKYAKEISPEDGDFEHEYEIIMDYLQDYSKNAMCAVGSIINSQNYSSELEEKNFIDNEDVIEAVKLSNPSWNMNNASFAMLSILQLIHDSVNVDNWSEILESNNFEFDSNNSFKKVNINRQYITSAIKSFASTDYLEIIE